MNGISMSIKVTPNYAGLSPLYYDVGLYPLAVSFDKLVAALTCPTFRLDALQEDVAWSVLRAAVGKSPQEICSVEKNPFEGKDEYTWEAKPTQTSLTYIAKKGDEEAFRIVFQGSEPVVWIRSADEETVREALDKALEIKNRQYVLTVKIANPKTGWYLEYGQTSGAKIKTLADAAMSPGTIATYTAACVATTILCEGIKVSLGNPIGIIKAVAYEAPGCALGAVFSGLAFKASANNLSYLAANPAGWLSYIGAEYVKLQGIKTGAAGYSRIYGGLAFRGSPFSTMRKIYTISDAFRTDKASDISKALGELAETLKSSPSTIPGVSYSNVKVSTLIGIKGQAAGEFAQKLAKAKKIKKYLSDDEIKALTEVLDAAKTGQTIEEINPKDLEKFGSALEKLKKSGFLDTDYAGAKALRTAYEDVLDNLSHPQTLVQRIGEEAGEGANLRKSFGCGALGNIMGSVTAYASLYYGPLKGFDELFLNVCNEYPDRPVQITIKRAPTNKTWTIFVGSCNWGAPESSNIPSININAG